MCPNPHFPADLVTFTEEILNGKLHFLCSKDSRLSFNFRRFETEILARNRFKKYRASLYKDVFKIMSNISYN